MEKRYEIVTNVKGHKILVLNELIDVEKDDTLTFEDFDAIFLNIDCFTSEEMVSALQHLSPFVSNKCWIKPRFFLTQEKIHLQGATYLIDGQADSPYDIVVTERIEDILERISYFNVPRYVTELHSHITLCLRLCCYCFVRGFTEFSSTSVPGLAIGFTALFNALFVTKGENKRNAMFEFIEKLLDHKYVIVERHLDRIHLCPDCHAPHLLFIECCPKCKSSDIRQESVIHHFRCANVSPESSYEYDGQLRCPKCKQYVRHIGVDYDRPADVYSCHSCDNTFLHSDMRVYCAHCGKTSAPEDLQPHDINVYRFTEEGIRDILDDRVLFSLSKDIWNGYTPFDLYLNQLRWFSQSSTPHDTILVMRFRLSEPGLNHKDLLAFTQDMHVHFYQYNFTTHGRYFYLSHRCSTHDMEHHKERLNDELISTVTKLLSHYSNEVSYEDKQGFDFFRGNNPEEFIHRLNISTH